MLVIFILLLASLPPLHCLFCAPGSSCQNRCYQPLTIQDLTSVSTEFGHLRCRCDHLCYLYGDCCQDYKAVCPRQESVTSRWLLITQRNYLKCVNLDLEDQYPKNLLALSKCRESSDVFLQALCQAPPDFHNFTSFIPVTAEDGRVFRNRYCAKCLDSAVKVSPWETVHIECFASMRLGENQFPFDHEGIFLHDHRSLSDNFQSSIKQWLTRYCSLKLRPYPGTDLHFCNPEMESRNVNCSANYDPVWVHGTDGKMIFQNGNCAEQYGYRDNVTKNCLDKNDSVTLLGSGVSTFSTFKFKPGSLTILLNFGPDGKTSVNMVDADHVVRSCPAGYVFESATKKCLKMHCPPDHILLEDGQCKPHEKEENRRYETHVNMHLELRYLASFEPIILSPDAESLLRIGFSDHLKIEEGGMLNFSITAITKASHGEDNSTKLYAYCAIDMELIMARDTETDARKVLEFIDELNKNLTEANEKYSSVKVVKLQQKFLHLVLPNENEQKEVQEVKWCTNGNLKAYHNGTFEITQKQLAQLNETGNSTQTLTFITTFDTETKYAEGQFDLSVVVKTDLATDKSVLDARAIVCEPHPRIKDINCTLKVIFNSAEYRILKNRSIEVLKGHHIYGLEEYEVFAISRELTPSVDKENATGKIIVCLHHNDSKYVEKDVEFINISEAQGILTLTLMPVSILGLIATISIYTFFKNLRNLPGLVLLHLTLSLLLSQIFLLIGFTYPFNEHWCSTIAVLNHYLILLSFSWMNIYAINIYGTLSSFTNLSTMKNYSIRNKLRKYCALAYGFPLLWVSICVTIDLTTGWINYGGKSLVFIVKGDIDHESEERGYACWINNTMASLVINGIPCILMVCANIILYILTVRHVKASKHKILMGRRASSLSVSSESPVDLKMFLKLSSVMGFTWILGYGMIFVKNITVSEVGTILQEILSFLFICSTALQGVGIFVAFATGLRVRSEFAQKFGGSKFDFESRRVSNATVTSSTSSTPEIKARNNSFKI